MCVSVCVCVCHVMVIEQNKNKDHAKLRIRILNIILLLVLCIVNCIWLCFLCPLPLILVSSFTKFIFTLLLYYDMNFYSNSKSFWVFCFVLCFSQVLWHFFIPSLCADIVRTILVDKVLIINFETNRIEKQKTL